MRRIYDWLVLLIIGSDVEKKEKNFLVRGWKVIDKVVYFGYILYIVSF